MTNNELVRQQVELLVNYIVRKSGNHAERNNADLVIGTTVTLQQIFDGGDYALIVACPITLWRFEIVRAKHYIISDFMNLIAQHTHVHLI